MTARKAFDKDDRIRSAWIIKATGPQLLDVFEAQVGHRDWCNRLNRPTGVVEDNIAIIRGVILNEMETP